MDFIYYGTKQHINKQYGISYICKQLIKKRGIPELALNYASFAICSGEQDRTADLRVMNPAL